MIRLLINVKEIKPPKMARDKFRDICRRAFSHIGQYWYKNFFPNHFTIAAKRKYGHKDRSSKYRANKEKLARRGIVAMGGVVDNVFTGDMARQLLSGSIIRGYPTRATVTMRGPNYMRMNFRSGSAQPNKKRELVALTKEEMRLLLAEFKRFVAKEFKAWRGTRSNKVYS